MKSIRPEFDEQEYMMLKQEADALGVSLKQLVRNRALRIATEDTPLSKAKILGDEISKCRIVLNEIIRRETYVEERLYEDDIIRIEMTMNNIEKIVAAFIAEEIKRWNTYGDA